MVKGCDVLLISALKLSLFEYKGKLKLTSEEDRELFVTFETVL